MRKPTAGALLSCLLLSASIVLAGGGPNVTGAKLYIQQNKLDKALRVLLKEVEQVNPKNEDAWYLLGYIYARQEQYDKMVEAFDKAVELKPKFRKENKGVKISKDSGTEFHSKFGADMIKQMVWGKSFNKGVKFFNDALNAPTDSLRTAYFEQAALGFKAAGMIQPDSSMSFRNMAAAYMNLGKYEESISPLKVALERNPRDNEIKTLLAQVYMASGKDSLAMPMFEQLWADGVHSEEVADFLARGHMKAGDMDGAQAIYKEAIEANPNNYNFRYNYGTILLESKDYDAAIEQLTKAYEFSPESADINYNLGAAYLNRGVAKREALPEDSQDKAYVEDFRLALPYLEKSTKINPDDTNTWFALGRIAGQLDKIALAGYAFSKGEPTKSAFNKKLIVGMPSTSVKLIFGEPDAVNPIESEQLSGIEEWVYKKRKAVKGKVAVTQPVNVYVTKERVDAIWVIK